MGCEPYKTTATVKREEEEYWISRGFLSDKDYRKWWFGNTEAGRRSKRLTRKKVLNRRKRELGFIPLNEHFPGSVGHHVNRENVVYMSEEMHKSIPHNVKTGEGMEEINQIAALFL